MTESIKIYDTTLRDGTQGEGVSFTVAGKIRVTEKLDHLVLIILKVAGLEPTQLILSFFKKNIILKIQNLHVLE